MATEIGSKGLAEVNLTIPQGTSLAFDVIHKGDDDEIIDHSLSNARMAFQTKDKKKIWQLDSCVDCGAERIWVDIPASATEELPIGKLLWDLIITTDIGEQIRVCYGQVSIVDTYALDEEQ